MPTQPVRSVQRAAQVLKVLAVTPERDLSLSEIARAVGIHRSSCQAVLLALCAEELAVRREPGPHYRLGPQLLGLGRAAGSAVTLTDVLDAALLRLRDEFQASALAGTPHGDAVVITAARGVPHPYGLTVRAGSAVPLRAPAGPIYVAWADDATRGQWLDRADPALTPARRRELTAALSAVRARGWSATLTSRGDADATRSAREVTDTELALGRLQVIGISAPVWSPGATLASSLALTGLPGDFSGAELRQAAGRLVEVAAEVTSLTGGIPPDPPGATRRPPGAAGARSAADDAQAAERRRNSQVAPAQDTARIPSP
ncbi:IclR family transcriptional regulator [Frankia sp. AgB32]|uniref:IclR family transcriptional regulator n=1 Tax=Frankia sp. AgB32 TaxID=631119 RepID=UPI00200FD06E|nr:helix-turn-helix domain-containing protein [Frankia sp. AgB32]MCK9897145.1 helix-turn-helix domain-containing protein [Frankia sp. AgB32]